MDSFHIPYLGLLEKSFIAKIKMLSFSEFVFGKNFVVALTKEGELFSWGENEKYQLGMNHTERLCIPTMIPNFLENKVIDIDCGSTHSIALCDDNQVFVWGNGTCISSNSTNETDAIGITCSAEGAFYLNTDGEVFGIGYLFLRTGFPFPYAIGDGNYWQEPRSTWLKLKFSTKIKKIAAGKHHAIALDEHGDVFLWGDNDKRQLDAQTENKKCAPTKFMSVFGKIIDIAANSQSDLSAVMTESFKILVWGGYQGGYFMRPFSTSYASFDEVFGTISDPNVTYSGCMQFENKDENESLETGTLGSIFDVQNDSDLTIRIEENDIFVHKVILKARSEYFNAMFTNQWKETNKKILKIDGYSYNTFRSFLLYLYTGKIVVTSENVFELINLADQYLDESLLKLIEKEIENSTISGEVIKIIKKIMKLPQSDYENFCLGVQKFMVHPSSKFLD